MQTYVKTNYYLEVPTTAGLEFSFGHGGGGGGVGGGGVGLGGGGGGGGVGAGHVSTTFYCNV